MVRVKDFLKRLAFRHQEPIPLHVCMRSGFKGFIAISLLVAISYYSEVPLIMAPFGASCILIITMPHDELSQPANVIGGYFISTLVTIVFVSLFPHEWWLIGLMLGVIITAMAALRVTHAPAGAVPLIVYFYREDVGFDFLLFPVVTGTILLVCIAIVLHNIPPGRGYPKQLPEPVPPSPKAVEKVASQQFQPSKRYYKFKTPPH